MGKKRQLCDIIRLFFLVLVIHCLPTSSARAGADWQPLPKGEISRIAFGSCAKQWQHEPIWDTITTSKPDLFLFLGDAVYSDTDGATAWTVSDGQLLGEWNRLADKTEFQRAKEAFPFMATWDNHDYGTHNGGAEFLLKETSKKIFLDFFGEPKDTARRMSPGIYDAKIFGPKGRRVQIILLDTRYFKNSYAKDSRSKEHRLKAGRVGDNIVVAGGFGVSGILDATMIFDAKKRIRFQGPDLPARRHHVYPIGREGEVLAIGGYEPQGEEIWHMQSTVFTFDRGMKSWNCGPDLPEPRAEFAAGNIDGTVIVTAGRKKIAQWTGSRDDHTIDPETFLLKSGARSWDTGAPIPTPRMSCAAVVLNGRLHVLGGQVQTGKGISYRNVAAHEAYDPKTDTWEQLPPLQRPAAGIAAAVWGDKIYVLGGEEDKEPYEVYDNVFVYDPAIGSWSVEKNLPEPLHGHGAVAMDDGIHILGGSTTSG